MATNPAEILAQARQEEDKSRRKTNALHQLMMLATEVAEVVKDVTDERGLDTENEEHLGEAPNPHQLLTDRKLAVKERLKLQERDILQPPPMPPQQSGPILKVDEDREMGRTLPVTPKSNWMTAKDLAMSQAEQAEIEQQRRVVRKLKSLARTPHPMLLARIQQLVSSFAEIRRDVASVKQALQAALLATKRSGRTFRRGQSVAASRALRSGPSISPTKVLQSGLMLQLDGAESPTAEKSKFISLTGRPREEERLCALENKERTLGEELAVTLQFLSERLRMLPLPLLMQLVPSVTLQQCEQHSLIYNRDEEATTFYVVLSGTFESILLGPGEVYRPLVPKKLLAIYRRGACFGESELLHGTSRSTTVVCNSVGLIACVSQRDYLEVLGKYLIKQQGLTKSFLRLKVEPLRSLSDSSIEVFIRFLEPKKLAEGFEYDVMQERPATLYIILEGRVQFQALDHHAAPSLEEAQAQVRDPAAPTMAEKGVLANVTVMEGGHAQGTLGQASRLKELVRKMTPTKVLGDGNVGAVFGGGKALLGEGDLQDCIKVVALTPLHVLAVPVEQLLLSDPGGVVAALRQYIALQITYWFSRCGMISKHTAVGHKSSELCLQVARAARAAEEQIKKEKLRKAARINAQKVSGSQKTKRGDVVEACLKHVCEVRKNFEAEIARAQIDKYGTPTEKFWAGSEAATENHARANQVLERVFPHKLQPLCNRLDVLQERAEQRAIKAAHLAERQVLLRQNSAILDDFMSRLKRPVSAAEAQTLLKATGGLDIPEDNALNLRPMTATPQRPPRAPYSEVGDCMSTVSFMERPNTSPAAPGKKPGELSAACRMWENSQGRRVPAVRQMLTFGEIRRHKIEKAMLSDSGESPATAATTKGRRKSMHLQKLPCQGG